MKQSVLRILVVLLIGWPACVVGYVFAAIQSGFFVGRWFYRKHEDAAIKRLNAETEEGQN